MKIFILLFLVSCNPFQPAPPETPTEPNNDIEVEAPIDPEETTGSGEMTDSSPNVNSNGGMGGGLIIPPTTEQTTSGNTNGDSSSSGAAGGASTGSTSGGATGTTSNPTGNESEPTTGSTTSESIPENTTTGSSSGGTTGGETTGSNTTGGSAGMTIGDTTSGEGSSGGTTTGGATGGTSTTGTTTGGTTSGGSSGGADSVPAEAAKEEMPGAQLEPIKEGTKLTPEEEEALAREKERRMKEMNNCDNQLLPGVVLDGGVMKDWGDGYYYELILNNKGKNDFKSYTLCFYYDHEVTEPKNAKMIGKEPLWKFIPQGESYSLLSDSSTTFAWEGAPGKIEGDPIKALKMLEGENADCPEIPPYCFNEGK